jgi:FixJ family two-component response regulator
MTEAIQQILNGNVPAAGHHPHARSGTHRRLNETPSFLPELLQALTRKQLLVLERMTKGESNKQIAYTLEIAETTVKAHVGDPAQAQCAQPGAGDPECRISISGRICGGEACLKAHNDHRDCGAARSSGIGAQSRRIPH